MTIDELLDERIAIMIGDDATLSRSQDIELFKIATIQNNFSNQEYRDYLQRKNIHLPSTPPPEPTSNIRLR